MASIYEITNDILFIEQMLEEGEIDQEALIGALDVSKEDLIIKLDNYCKFIKNLESDNAGIKAEEDRLAAIRKRNEKTIEKMMYAMQNAMMLINEKKLSCGTFTVSVRKNPAAVVLDCDEVFVPDKYLIAQAPKIDKKALKEDLSAGVDLSGIAHLESAETLKIN